MAAQLSESELGLVILLGCDVMAWGTPSLQVPAGKIDKISDFILVCATRPCCLSRLAGPTRHCMISVDLLTYSQVFFSFFYLFAASHWTTVLGQIRFSISIDKDPGLSQNSSGGLMP